MQFDGEHNFLITLGLILVLAIGIVCVCMTIACSIIFSRGQVEQSKNFGKLLERANALQMATVILIIVGACALRTVNGISAEAVVSILSGVAGYVLGGSAPLFRAPKRADEKD